MRRVSHGDAPSPTLGYSPPGSWTLPRTIIVGDIHGCYGELLDLCAAVGLNDDDTLVSVGDLVDRGPGSVEADDAIAETRAASGRARYADRGELRYSMRSLHLFAPWVRRIHLVTAGQVPDWLDADHPRVNLVDHRDLFPA